MKTVSGKELVKILQAKEQCYLDKRNYSVFRALAQTVFGNSPDILFLIVPTSRSGYLKPSTK